MTKREYCESKGLHTSIPFDPNEEADEDFKEFIDCLVDGFMEIFKSEG